MGGIVQAVTAPIGGIVGGLASGLAGPGSNYQASPASVVSPVTAAQANAAQQASLDALAQQQALASQLAGAGGLQTQQDVLKQQQALASQLQGRAASEAGAQNQQTVFDQQQALANQLQNQALGQGPNPAQEQYRQNINSGIQAAAGNIASQKGISPALAAELIARQQGAANQNAAGQQAVLQAQQQLSAQQQLAAQQAALQGVAQSQVGQQQTAAQQLAQQQAQLQGVAAGQVGQQLAGQQSATGGAQQQQGMLLNAITGANQANVAAQNSAQEINAGVANANAARQGQMVGGLLNAGGALGSAAIGKGGAMGALGGLVESAKASRSDIPEHLAAISAIYHPHYNMAEISQGDPLKEFYDKKIEEHKTEKAAAKDAKSKRFDFTESPEKKASGGYASFQEGALVPGKAKVPHNSYSNDTVKALLSPGEVVIPLDVMNSKDPVQGAAKFVAELLKKKSPEKDDDKAEFHKAVKEAISKRKK